MISDFKHEQVLAAVITHPGLTARDLMGFVPSIDRQTLAAGYLDALFRAGKIDRRPGPVFWTWWPKPIVEGQAEAVAPAPRPEHRTYAERLFAEVQDQPGRYAAELAEPLGIQQNVAATILRSLCTKGRLSRALKDGVYCYWLAGEAPEDDGSRMRRGTPPVHAGAAA